MIYKEYRMEDALETILDYRGKTPEKSKDGIMTLSAKSVRDGYIDYSQCYYISKSEYNRFMVRGFPKTGDVLMTTEAPLGVTARLDRDDIALAQRLLSLRGKEGILDTGYLYYYLRSPIGQAKLMERQTGTTVTGIKQSEFRKIKISLPSYEIQKKITSFLEVMDKKTKNNKEINENLAQLAQTIYADIFITNANLAWPLGHLSDLITVRYGKDHKKLDDGPFPVYGSGGVMRYVERPIYEKESVLIPRKGTLNNVMYVNEPFWSVDTMFFTEMKLPDVAKFVFHFVKSKDLSSLNAGSAVPSMTTEILNAMELCIPDSETLKRFESIVGPMYRAMQHNTEESKKLAAVRDTLLPRLMSGELDVSDLHL